MFAFTAAASNGSPSWNTTPSRSRNVSARPSSDCVHDVASCGITERSGAVSTSLSHSAVNTIRPE